MNRISDLFQTKQQNILSIYYPAGYPNLQDTVPILRELEKAGVDMVEIGIPFSDPMADGPVIQEASSRAMFSFRAATPFFPARQAGTAFR